jgi:hypothetical protein
MSRNSFRWWIGWGFVVILQIMNKKEIVIYGIITSVMGSILFTIIFYIASNLISIAQDGVIMVGEILSTSIPLFWLVIALLFFALIIALIAKKVWIDLPKRYVLKSKLDEWKKQNGDEIKKIKLKEERCKSELEDKTKQHNDLIRFHESDLKKKVQLTDCNIKLHYQEGNQKLTITQNLINMSSDKLVLKSLFLYVKVDGAEIDKIVYDYENAISDLGKKIFVSDLPPYEINCCITCETTKLLGVMSNYHGEKMRIDVDGEICFFVQSGKVTKKVKEMKEFEFGTKEI